ncbi:MAG: SDR family oxidoreductase [Aeromicrobium sp.]|nr:SDR family oxidoreductase [Burkholderiales bacterium]
MTPRANTASFPSLRDRVVFISGGGSGIGAALVEHFVAQHSKVAFSDIDEAAGEALVAKLADATHCPQFVVSDVRDIAAYQVALKSMIAALGPITVLINNAGNDQRHSLEELTPDYWDNCLAVNLKHHVFAIQAVAPSMAAAGGGSIINLGSVSWMRGRPNLIGYTSSKAAISGLSRTLARELGDKNIRVNALVPGAIVTDRQQALWRDPDSDRQFLDFQCLKYRLDASHVARTALFLASDDADGITGQNIIVDAGLAQVSVAG